MAIQVVYSLETATAYIVGNRYLGLANNGMTPDERAALDLTSHEASLRRGGSKAQIVGWCLYTLVLWLLKICMNACYTRVTCVNIFLLSFAFSLTRLQASDPPSGAARQNRLGPHRIHIPCRPSHHPPRLQPLQAQLANLPRPREYVIFNNPFRAPTNTSPQTTANPPSPSSTATSSSSSTSPPTSG